MDHWADPWADDADTDSRPPPKTDVQTPLPAAPPAVLNGFLDDAQWGSVERDEGWGEWAAKPSDATPHEEAHRTLSPPLKENEPWTAAEEEDHTETHANRTSEASDSGTTIHPEDNHEPSPPEPDDDHSTRPSVSISEASHTESVTDSPRTSFEEERLVEKAVQSAPPTKHLPKAAEEHSAGGLEQPPNPPEPQSHVIRTEEKRIEAPRPFAIGNAAIDPLLLQLFPAPEKDVEQPPPPQDDPIFSTSARKAWYRLTRQQTMREYNSGAEDNTYVRVTWATSKIREDVNKIVSRWATEDRIAGRSHVGRVSFYWDKPVEPLVNSVTAHGRKWSSLPPVLAHTVKQETESPVSDVPVAFNWSSTSTGQDIGEKQTSSMPQSPALLTPPPIPAPASTIKEASRQPPEQTVQDIPEPKSEAVQCHTSPIIAESDQKDHMEASDGDREGRSKDTAQPDIDDDEDWGDMVQSPTVTNSPPHSSFFESTTPPETPTATSRVSARTTPAAIQQPMSKHAAPIVRLQGVVSPTSAVFNAKPLIPPHVEQGPIGPHILRKAKNSPHATPEKPKPTPPEPSQAPVDSWADADFSIFDSAPAPPTPPPVAPPPPLPSISPASKSLPSRSDTPSTTSTIPSQSRKSEDDELVRSIISSLPDLSYMLQR